jgi:hypothetical protein
MQVSPVIRRLVEILSKLQGKRRATVLTTLLLLDLDDLALRKQCLNNLDGKSAEVDEELVLGLSSAGDRKVKLALAGSAVVSRMRPRAFRQIFDDVYARSQLTWRERRELMWNLERFLILNPRQAPAYERIVLELAKSPHLELSVRGIPMAARFTRINPDTFNLLASKLKSRSEDLRGSALEGFYYLLERVDRLAPNVRKLITSDTFREQVARIQKSDPDDPVRHNARSVLRKLRGAARASGH